MKTTIPPVIESYFLASNANDIEALVACFAPDATVFDEHETHRGTAEIKAWCIAVRKKFEFQSKMLKVEEDSGATVVSATVSGNFPGSPVDLDYKFMLNGDKITSLDIR